MSKRITRHVGARTCRYLVAATSAAMVLALASCAGEDSEGDSASDEIRILAPLGLSGLSAPSAEIVRVGAKAAVEHANSNGGVDGRRVVIEFVDTQSDPSRAVSVLKQKIAEERPDIVYSGSSSTDVVAMLPALTQEKIPFVTNTVATDIGLGEANPYSFSSLAGQDLVADYYVKTFTDRGIDRIGLLYADVPAGATAAESYKRILPESGIEVVDASYDADALDMSAELERLKSEDVDAVLFWSLGPAGGYILKSRNKIGMTTPLFGDTSAASANIGSVVTAEEAEGVELAVWNINVKKADADQTQGSKDLVAQLAADEVEYTGPLSLYALAYDAILLSLNAFADAEDPSDVASWAKAMIAPGEPTFAPAISAEKTGWTAENRFRQDMGPIQLIPASTPLVDGQFELP